MYKLYFKQAIEMLRQNKFISIISIAGTALAIMMIMVLIVTQQIKEADVSPENNRSHILYLKAQMEKKEHSSRSGPLSYETVKDLVMHIENAEYTSGFIPNQFGSEDHTIKTRDMKTRMPVELMATDVNYWKILSFSFIAGKPFSQAEFDSGLRNVIVSRSLAEKVFGKQDAMGKTIDLNNNEYTVSGIVENVSNVFACAYADVWIPYTSMKGYEKMSSYMGIALAKSKSDFPAITEEVRAYEKKRDLTSEWTLNITGPFTHYEQLINPYGFSDKSVKTYRYRMIFIFSILFLVPAINLSGLSLSRVKRRTEEIGVRKAFGAKKRVILIQILYENFITSLLGGIIGLILSYFVVIILKGWLLGANEDSAVPLTALVSLPVFLAVVVVSFILNLLSSGIPAYKAAGMKIVDSLNRNNN